IVKRLAGYALSLPALILHLPAALVLWGWEKAFFRDPDLVPAARFVVGTFLVPLWYLTALVLWHIKLQTVALDFVLAVLMPLSLWLRSRSWHWTRRGRGKTAA
ncbi:hypothetical protein ACFL0I_05440, partial [Gemmatimonadota bacterium]